MSVQYTGWCAVQRGIFSTLGGYHEYTGVSSTPGDYMSTPGDYMSTPGDIMINVREGHWENN